jgi:uncharacterized membrane protein
MRRSEREIEDNFFIRLLTFIQWFLWYGFPILMCFSIWFSDFGLSKTGKYILQLFSVCVFILINLVVRMFSYEKKNKDKDKNKNKDKDKNKDKVKDGKRK